MVVRSWSLNADVYWSLHVVEIDNERGKGDHCPLDGKEFPYRFAAIDQLIEDFIKEVDKGRTR
ncbi:MAG: peptidylprolyl isomerase [Candidatus Accumulibacter delftensis]